MLDYVTNLTYYADKAFENDWSNLVNDLINTSIDGCKQVKEDLYLHTALNEYQYTLYYYDQSGNLVQTVPPEGVKPIHSNQLSSSGSRISGQEPAHYLLTQYKYNSRNQVVWQNTPDAGISQFWYNYAGQLILSQNAKQQPLNKFSFTTYDAQGRIETVGEWDASVTPYFGSPPDYNTIQQAVKYAKGFPANIPNEQANITQLTYTRYDLPITVPGLVQENLRNRVAASFRFDNYDQYTQWKNNPTINDDVNYTAYTYDEIGNVKALVQHVAQVKNENNTILIEAKDYTVHYDYDLISGNVNKVTYQKGKPGQQFIHKYTYDNDNRITQVETSLDGYIWDTDAKYYYYPHGPLARVEIGQDNLQGIDYYYTLQGWLKGINGKDQNTDPAKDGFGTGDFANFSRDAFALQLAYFDGDYTAIGGQIFSGVNHTSNKINNVNLLTQHTTGVDAKFGNTLKGNEGLNPSYTYSGGLYNGNIAMQYTYLPIMEENQAPTELYSHYQYDQLNRLKGAVGKYGDNLTTNAYQTAYNFDKMGNITHLVRKDDNLDTYDDFIYKYDYHNAPHSPFANNKKLLHNRLQSVSDAIADAVSGYNDLPGGQQDVNYTYDDIGNLIADEAEEIETIEWDVYGKIAKIIRKTSAHVDKSNLEFKYDASGNRTHKIEYPRNGGNIKVTTYIRDAQGNILATHEYQDNNQFNTEYNLYGSSRLGVYKKNQIAHTNGGHFLRLKNKKMYEITNHLGNVLIVLGDTKYYDDDATDPHYTTQVISAQDYLPFGMLMPGRQYTNTTLSEKYRYGFNGQEQERELNPSITSALYWMYDARRGGRWNVDPVVKNWESGYAVFGNNPIVYNDPEGDNPPGYEWGVAPTQQSINNFFNKDRMDAILRVSTEQDVSALLLMRIIYRENTTRMAVKPLGKFYKILIADMREFGGMLKAYSGDISQYDMRSVGIIQMQLRHVIRLQMGMTEGEYDVWKERLLSNKAGKTTFARILTGAEFILDNEQSAFEFLGKHLKELQKLNPNSTDDELHGDYMRGVQKNRLESLDTSPRAQAAIKRTNNALPLLQERLENYQKDDTTNKVK